MGGFSDPHEYPVATATHKAVEVYERLVVSHLVFEFVRRVAEIRRCHRDMHGSLDIRRGAFSGHLDRMERIQLVTCPDWLVITDGQCIVPTSQAIERPAQLEELSQ